MDRHQVEKTDRLEVKQRSVIGLDTNILLKILYKI